ncbi:hypothetical protein AAFN47_15070 [Hoeflea sp. CAU 1731]
MRANSLYAALVLCAVVGAPILGQGAGLGLFPSRIPVDQAAATIWTANEDRILACGLDLKRWDMRAASALVAIEAYSTPALERLAENTVLPVMARLGLPLPDWSVGLAQIRPSTGAGLGEVDKTQDLALSIAVDDCLSVRLAVGIVRRLARDWNEEACDADCMIYVARAYNGQREINSANLAYIDIFGATLKQAEKAAARM